MSQSQPPRRGGSSGRRRPTGSGPTTRKPDPSIAPLHPTLEPPDIKSFREWNLGEELQGAIESMGITTPTPIQRLAIQPVLDGRDVIAKAETGTGKTLAFGAPMMAKIDPARASVLGLVLCPTRELAEQGQKVLEILGKPRGIKVALVVGGEPLEPQVAALKGGAQVVVGTPGRILDLYKQRFLSFPWTEFTILDEADVMLEIGFIDDVKQILSYAPDERQTLLFSATFPPELLKLAREYTKNPVEVATASGVSTVANITQTWIPVEEDDRSLALIRLIEQSSAEDIFLVFCDRRTEVDKLMRRLERLPFSIKALHGGYDQAARFRVMSAFRTGEVKVLVATDVASRGLDVAHVTTVVNYSSPHDITDYTHRIGRTGRAGRKGRAITLVGGMDMRKWRPIQRDATWDIPQAEVPGPSRGPSGSRGSGSSRGSNSSGGSGFSRGDRSERPESTSPREDRPRREERAPRSPAPVRDDGRAWNDAPESPRRDDSLAPAANDAGRWPVDEDALSEAARHRDLRPNRESPRSPAPRSSRPEPRHRDAAPRDDRGAPRRDEPTSRERTPRREPDAGRDSTVRDSTVRDTTVRDTTVRDTTVRDTTVRDTTVRSDAPARRVESGERPASPSRAGSPRRDDAARRPESRDDRPARTSDRGAARPEREGARGPTRDADRAPREPRGDDRTASRSGHSERGERPQRTERAAAQPTARAAAPRSERAPAARADARPTPRAEPRSAARTEGRPAARVEGERAPRRPAHEEHSSRPASPRPDRSQRPASAPRSAPPERGERPRRAAPAGRSTPPPELEERPPGTFERPMSGGLLGHAARRPVAGRPTEGESSRRPRRGRDH